MLKRRRKLYKMGVLGGGAPAVATLTATTTAPSETLTLQRITADEPFTINWGDGSTSEIEAGRTTAITHVYASAGAYTVTMPIDAGYTYLDLRDSKISGTAIDLPRATYYLFLSNVGITGPGIDLPRVTSYLYLSNVAITGPAIDLPRVTNYLYLLNVDITGPGIDLPRVTNTLSLLNVDITGPGIDLPRVTNSLSLENISISGPAIDLPRVTSYVLLINSAVTGPAIDFPRVTSYLYLRNVTVAGELAGFPSPSTQLFIDLTSTASTLTPGATPVSFTRLDRLDVDNLSLSQSEVDAWIDRLYADRATITTGTKIVSLGGNNAAPSASPQIDTYIPALTSAGFTVTYTSP